MGFSSFRLRVDHRVSFSFANNHLDELINISSWFALLPYLNWSHAILIELVKSEFLTLLPMIETEAVNMPWRMEWKTTIRHANILSFLSLPHFCTPIPSSSCISNRICVNSSNQIVIACIYSVNFNTINQQVSISSSSFFKFKEANTNLHNTGHPIDHLTNY